MAESNPKSEKIIDALDTLRDAECGILSDRLSRALRDVAHGVVEHGRVGEVTLKLTLKRIGESQQVAMSHRVSFQQPTKRGKRSEEATTETPYYVGANGLTLMPDTKTHFDFAN